MHPASPHQHRSRLHVGSPGSGQVQASSSTETFPLTPQPQHHQSSSQHTVHIPPAASLPYQGLKTSENDDMGCVEILATAISVLIMILTFPISVFICFKVVSEYERAVIFRMGRLRSGGARGPGVFFVLPCVDDYYPVDLRTVSFDVPPQEVLSKDSVTVTVDAVVYYRISDPLKAVIQVYNYSHSTSLLAATTLRNVLGTRNLSELLTERKTISDTMQMSLDEATDPWGVKVERVEIKDVSLPTALQRAMAAEAEAAREARAKVIAAEGEMKSSRALREASEIISASPSALQLRYLQTLSSISTEKNSTIIFPLPMELLTPFLNSHNQYQQQQQQQQQQHNMHSHPPAPSTPLHRHQHQHHQ
ncbi:band 7 protein AGAP004871 [Drosophila subobscura]|uniref:band 7 protein AGAP004871 n=1 Tax=Drosophila subobscura TaxID=7241 RepID=UPI00155A155E|nr:band 7 protein AGAP004871 [Drosophila subobscura]